MQKSDNLFRRQRSQIGKPRFQHIADEIDISNKLLNDFDVETHVRAFPIVLRISNERIRKSRLNQLRWLKIDGKVIARLEMRLFRIICTAIIFHLLDDRNINLRGIILCGASALCFKIQNIAGRKRLDDVVQGGVVVNEIKSRGTLHIWPPKLIDGKHGMVFSMHNARFRVHECPRQQVLQPGLFGKSPDFLRERLFPLSKTEQNSPSFYR